MIPSTIDFIIKLMELVAHFLTHFDSLLIRHYDFVVLLHYEVISKLIYRNETLETGVHVAVISVIGDANDSIA